MYILICNMCKSQFTNIRHNRKFCSQDCYHKNREETGVTINRPLSGQCEICKIPILKQRKRCKDCHAKFLAEPRKRYKTTDRITCDKCGVIKTEENTFSPEPGLWSTKCRKCCRKVSKISEFKIKQELVDYKGGKCEVCGYNKCNAALDFHHKDPTQKDFTIARNKQSISNDKIKEELDKCVLLCSNCHREEHFRLKSGEPSLIIK